MPAKASPVGVFFEEDPTFQSYNAPTRALILQKYQQQEAMRPREQRFARVAFPHERELRKYEREFGLPSGLAVALSSQESGSLGMKARSAKGALGVMQIMPATRRELAKKYGNNHYRQGVGYLRDLRETFAHVPEDQRWSFAIGAYNAGPHRVQKAQEAAVARGLDPSVWGNVAQFVPPETREYVPKVQARHQRFGQAYGDMLKEVPPTPPPVSVDVTKDPRFGQLPPGAQAIVLRQVQKPPVVQPTPPSATVTTQPPAPRTPPPTTPRPTPPKQHANVRR